MEEQVIRPTMKFIKIGYAAAIVLFLASLAAQGLLPPGPPAWALPVVFALLLLWPASRHVTQRFTKMTMAGDKLRYETGMLSKETRIISISKVQDVAYRQRFVQRMFGVGSVSIETAGETSRLTFPNVDDPKGIAERIIDARGLGVPDRREESHL